MKKWSLRVVFLAILAVAAFVAWRWFFPGDEQVIRKKLAELASAVSMSPNEGVLAKAANAQKVADFFAPEIAIRIDVPGYAQETLTGRQELFQLALAVRNRVSFLKVDFIDVSVTVGPAPDTATAHLTARAVSSDRDSWVEEMLFVFRKIDGEWRISRVETVKTLARRKPAQFHQLERAAEPPKPTAEL